MTDHAELRRLAEAAIPGPWARRGQSARVYAAAAGDGEYVAMCNHKVAAYLAAVDPQTVLALLDAAERADRAIATLRSFHGKPPHSDRCEACAFLAEVDRG